MKWIDIAHDMGQHDFSGVSVVTSSTTSVMNLEKGCIMRETVVTAEGSVTMAQINIPGVIYEKEAFRSLTMQEMLGDEMNGMTGKMTGLMETLGKFGRPT